MGEKAVTRLCIHGSKVVDMGETAVAGRDRHAVHPYSVHTRACGRGNVPVWPHLQLYIVHGCGNVPVWPLRPAPPGRRQ